MQARTIKISDHILLKIINLHGSLIALIYEKTYSIILGEDSVDSTD